MNCIVLEICAFAGYYAASSGNSLPTFRCNLSVPSLRVKASKDGTKRLYRNVGKELPLKAAIYFRRTQISFSRWKPVMTRIVLYSHMYLHNYAFTIINDMFLKISETPLSPSPDSHSTDNWGTFPRG